MILSLITMTYIGLWLAGPLHHRSNHVLPVLSITPLICVLVFSGVEQFRHRLRLSISSLLQLQGIAGLLAFELVTGKFVVLELAIDCPLFSIRDHYNPLTGIAFEITVGLGWFASLSLAQLSLESPNRFTIGGVWSVAVLFVSAQWISPDRLDFLILASVLISPYVLVLLGRRVYVGECAILDNACLKRKG